MSSVPHWWRYTCRGPQAQSPSHIHTFTHSLLTFILIWRADDGLNWQPVQIHQVCSLLPEQSGWEISSACSVYCREAFYACTCIENQRGCMQMCCVCACACMSLCVYVCVRELIGERDGRWRKLTVSVKNMCQSTHSVAELLGLFWVLHWFAIQLRATANIQKGLTAARMTEMSFSMIPASFGARPPLQIPKSICWHSLFEQEWTSPASSPSRAHGRLADRY